MKSVLLIAAALILLAGCAAPGAAQGGASGSASSSAPATTQPVTVEAPTAAPSATTAVTTTSGLTATIPAPGTMPTDSPAATTAMTATSATTSTTAMTATTATTAAATTAAAQSTAAPDASVAGTIRLTLQPDSQVGYRVREQLARLNLPSDAVGTTKAVTGTVVIQPDGKILSDQSKFVVDLSTLQSDSGMRDGYIKRSTLQTSTYPQAVFVPTAVQGLPSPLPTSGDVNFKLVGDLTVHGVTKPVTWDVQGKIAGNDLTGTAKTTFTFEDFGMAPPQTMAVLSVQDSITLEATYHLTASQQ